MSAGMSVYLVDARTVRAVPGSRNERLLARLLAREGQGESLAWLDEELGIQERFPGFTHAAALRDIFAGRFRRPKAYFAYAYAFGHACGTLGEWVHDAFHRCSGDLLREFDALFEAHRVRLRFWGGLVGNPPVRLPPGPDGPYVGHWTRAEAVRAAPAFEAMRAAGPHGEGWFEEYLDEAGDWLDMLAARRGSMLVAVWC
jgi:hypothetical protein